MKPKQMDDTFVLSNGCAIPCIGYGTWQLPDGDIAAEAVKTAIQVGYRHIDAAHIYRNEAGVGKGIRRSGIDRKDLFITSKLWNADRGYKTTLKAFEKTCRKIGVDYLDLYLIHWPASAHQFDNWEEINIGTWQAMIELYKAGRIKSIGVSNFKPHHLKALMEMEVKPMVNQIEFHPGQMQEEVVDYCKENGILVEAWSPLGWGSMLKNETLGKIASGYGRSIAQICLRWVLQNEVLPLTKSASPSRIIENSQIFDFEISETDMTIINAMPYCGGSGNDPDSFGI